MKNIRGVTGGGGGVREPQRGIVQLIKYDSSIRYWRQLKKYQRATEVSEGDRSMRGRQLKKISEGDRSIKD